MDHFKEKWLLPFRRTSLGAKESDSPLSFRGAWLGMVLLCTNTLAAPANESGSHISRQGPIEERNQFPLNLLFLGFHSRGGNLLSAGEQQISFSQVYSNIFVGSDAFFEQAQADPSGKRQKLTLAMLREARRNHPDEILYFVDSEAGRSELKYRIGLNSSLEVGVEVPFLSFRGGSFDSAFESYHQNLNLGNGGREFFVRGATQITVASGENAFLVTESPSHFELGDLTFFGRYGVHQSSRGSLALTLALKVPTGDERLLAGSGSTDIGAELESTHRWGAHRLHLAGGWVRVGEWKLLPDYDPVSISNILAGYELVWQEKISWIAQLQAQTTAFRGRAGNRLDDPTVELVGGLRWWRERGWYWEAAFIENIFNQDTGIDFGLRVGVGIVMPKR